MEVIDTGLQDKHGRAIHVDDVIEHRLGLNTKHGGPSRYRVIQSGKKFTLIYEHYQATGGVGMPIQGWFLKYSTVVDCPHIYG